MLKLSSNRTFNNNIAIFLDILIIPKVVNDIRKTLSGAILDPEDKIKDVLDDNDFVSIVLETDRPNPSLEQAEVSKLLVI